MLIARSSGSAVGSLLLLALLAALPAPARPRSRPRATSANLDARSCLAVLQGVDAATGARPCSPAAAGAACSALPAHLLPAARADAAKEGDVEQAVQLEARALRKLESRNKGSARKWKDCDTADGYDRAKHAYAHFRLAVALQAQGQPDAALNSFDLARTFDSDLEIDALLNMGLLR